jgi:protease I
MHQDLHVSSRAYHEHKDARSEDARPSDRCLLASSPLCLFISPIKKLIGCAIAPAEKHTMKLQGKKIAVLIEGDFYEDEILYYKHRFPEEGVSLHFLSRLWGQPALTFQGHEYRAPLTCDQSFENMDDATLRSYAAVIVPSGMVADRLRYTEDINKLPPATQFLQRAFAEPGIIKGIICHGMWLIAPTPELVRGRRVVVHNNLLGDARNMGAIYTDQDVVVDGDLVTGRSGGHCHLFARKIIDMLCER